MWRTAKTMVGLRQNGRLNRRESNPQDGGCVRKDTWWLGGICERLVNSEIDLLSPIRKAIGLNNRIGVA
jgi:hypothetical protein